MANQSKRAGAVRFGAVGVIIAAGFMTSQAHASVTTFAQFSEQSTQNSSVAFTKTGGIGTFKTTAPGGDPVNFSYTSYLGPLPVALQGSLNAMLSVTATTNLPASVVNVPDLGNLALQPFTSISLAFTLPTDFIYKGVDYGANLLTVTLTPGINPPVIAGIDGSNIANGTFSSDLVNIDYTSSFFDFSGIDASATSFSLSSLLNSFTLADGNTFVDPFVANMIGTFASEPRPTSVFPVPEPMSVVLLGLGLLGLAIVRRSFSNGSV